MLALIAPFAAQSPLMERRQALQLACCCSGSMKPAEEARNMWFSLFTVVLAAAICLSVASFIMREAKARS